MAAGAMVNCVWPNVIKVISVKPCVIILHKPHFVRGRAPWSSVTQYFDKLDGGGSRISTDRQREWGLFSCGHNLEQRRDNRVLGCACSICLRDQKTDIIGKRGRGWVCGKSGSLLWWWCSSVQIICGHLVCAWNPPHSTLTTSGFLNRKTIRPRAVRLIIWVHLFCFATTYGNRSTVNGIQFNRISFCSARFPDTRSIMYPSFFLQQISLLCVLCTAGAWSHYWTWAFYQMLSITVSVDTFSIECKNSHRQSGFLELSWFNLLSSFSHPS